MFYAQNNFLEFARTLASGAGELIRERLYAHKDLKIKTKSSPTDLVTEIDREVEEWIAERIKETYPEHGMLGEEGTEREGSSAGGSIYRWIVDPIDGTTNFIHQRINFCISIALYHGDEGVVGVVYDPIRNEMFWASRGEGAFLNGEKLDIREKKELMESLVGTNLIWLRRTRKLGLLDHVYTIARRSRGIRALGAAALEMAYVAAGRIDAFLSLKLSPWDFAAAKLLVEEAGGVVRSFTGDAVPIAPPEHGLIAARTSLLPELMDILNEERTSDVAANDKETH
ncbi:MAG: inositol monophosphatase [Candidatus Carbobacillus altaicus]|uniref:Inositol-1-monophosphatase n=1 Tax=Candidatus Carbonibacillus altaicus TaxID=2163959 RepID=A0A2R6Y5H1_9BACL|nr:inositol monophosphatase [Candidatus Carbobacillus altaicus]PTQ57921.1 MAG: Inositol-1-monophosphatase [Candidatus Carbobacillus altaicus]